MLLLLIIFLFPAINVSPVIGVVQGTPALPAGEYCATHPQTGVKYSGQAPSRHYYTDHLENVYFIDGYKLLKIDTATGEVMEFGSYSAGEITLADVSNPFQIMVLYRDFNRIVFLDNKLSRLRSEIDLSELGIEQAVLACTSGRGGMWIFSDRDNRIIYFDQQLRNTHQSMVIGSIAGPAGKPVSMTEAQNRLYLYIPRKGILVFDRFASYIATVPYSGPERFRVTGNNIIYYDGRKLISMDMESGEEIYLDLPSGVEIDDAMMHSAYLFLLSGNRFMLYGRR